MNGKEREEWRRGGEERCFCHFLMATTKKSPVSRLEGKSGRRGTFYSNLRTVAQVAPASPPTSLASSASDLVSSSGSVAEDPEAKEGTRIFHGLCRFPWVLSLCQELTVIHTQMAVGMKWPFFLPFSDRRHPGALPLV